jgi:DNA-binding NtrC family response regulator
MISKILFLDDRWQAENWKTSFDGWLPDSVETIYEEKGYLALQRIQDNPDTKLVFLDLRFEGQVEQGEQILDKIKERYPDLKVIILTSLNDVQLALKLVHDQKKAYYYLYKDEIDPEQLKKLIENAIESYDLRAEAIRRTDLGIIIGESSALKRVLGLAARASQVNSNVLITGESGTGKELIARAIHYNSRRKNGPFITMNCGAVSSSLIESELFGHVKGAFTDAIKEKKGRFERANNGTLFLDEIAELKPEAQASLLRVLQFGEFEKVGGEATQRVDARVVTATNKNLEELVNKRLFREDLYERLNVIPIHMPPLRERKEDIPLLVSYFLARLNDKLDTSKELSDEAVQVLKRYNWPRNIRNLENVLERALVISTSDIISEQDLADLLAGNAQQSVPHSSEDWIDKVLAGDSSWEEIRKEFGTSARRNIIEGALVALKEAQGKRPSGSELAALLKVTRGYLNVILNNLDLKLREI